MIESLMLVQEISFNQHGISYFQVKLCPEAPELQNVINTWNITTEKYKKINSAYQQFQHSKPQTLSAMGKGNQFLSIDTQYDLKFIVFHNSIKVFKEN